jgi:hypothetical protein
VLLVATSDSLLLGVVHRFLLNLLDARNKWAFVGILRY